MDDWLSELPQVKKAARRLIEMGAFAAQDADDIQQDLFLRLLQASALYRVELGSPAAYAGGVLGHATIDMRRKRRREFRSEVMEYAELPQVEQGLSLADTLALTDSLDSATGELRELAERLRWESLGRIARDWGVARSTLQRRVAQLKSHLERAGFGPERKQSDCREAA